MTATLQSAWYQALADLASMGVSLPEPADTTLESARREFEAMAGAAQEQRSFRKDGPKLAARILSEALARQQHGLDDDPFGPSAN